MRRIILVLTSIAAGVFAVSIHPATVFSAEISKYNGSFSGNLKQSGCRSDAPVPFSGVIKDGRVKGDAVKGQSFDWEVAADGTFGGELYLRSHRLGDKMQWYKVEIEGTKVHVKAEFGVPGEFNTYCTAEGTMDLIK